MAAVANHRLLIVAAEETVRATLHDGYGVMHSEECSEMIRGARGFFIGFVQLARREFDALQAEVERWRWAVFQGDKDFEPDDEQESKQAMSALLSFVSLLEDRYGSYYRRGILLVKPIAMGVLAERKRELERMLREWESPELSTAFGLRTIKFSREQSRQLLEGYRTALAAVSP